MPPMTFKALVEQLQVIAEHAPDTALVRVGGEYVDQFAISIQHPLQEKRAEAGYMRREHDKKRPQVVDVLVNGQEAEQLPIVTLDYLKRW